ncbi:TylF/MycF/NovP-related O-methyltransferase [Burkholderia diffusa]|uniref:TylF/MycF/NovP-related O-methyltransferase n=1 Tax=Burkholderia diffusa TaxID=488732 RepID=UPI00157B5F47|nr:TylF/MycF/NovP-related O-methyltransferase [Burkholderia diffusa]NTY37441.1 macrocin-O-methyltransferase [Burkholderia diffusa]
MKKNALPSGFVQTVDRYVFRRFGLSLRPLSHPTPPIEPWLTDPGFLAVWRRIEGRTLVEPPSAYLLHLLAAHCRSLDGDVAEVGSYRGGSAYLLATGSACPVHVFDTFTGMPPTDPERDIFREGDFGDTSLDDVSEFLAGLPHVTLYPGVFPHTAGPVAARSFRLVHVDVDIYRSVLDCCEFFYPRMVPGGILVFDDYGYLKCPGARLAVDQFFRDLPETPLYTPNGQAIVCRLGQ